MVRFDIITIFPEIFASYFDESIIKRAQRKKLIKINIHNLRDYAADRHRTVDDRPYGGGAGMILKVDIIFKAIKKVIDKKIGGKDRRIILLSAKGKPFNQKKAQEFAKKYKQVILISGRYEGVDERVAKYIADEEISIGEYVLTGGEIPAMVVVDAVSRLIPGVIKEESLKEESFNFKIQNSKFKESILNIPGPKRLRRENILKIGGLALQNFAERNFGEFPKFFFRAIIKK
ncbi:tRNA (guanosine(37)-N1)-methyltransferase TrmD [Patescibacteria group bacterium]|nr:tRNA (guanosine(37)-N1)-methyltransferase TrmD [Patescibacteria group bacterium]